VTELVVHFFDVFAAWDFSKPIFVHDPHDSEPELIAESQKSQLPIITPLRPYQCTTFGLTKSSKGKILEELVRARDIAKFLIHKGEVMKELLGRGEDGGFKFDLS
jgi:poly(A) polymerase Pap1